jgi:hypothetical protein
MYRHKDYCFVLLKLKEAAEERAKNKKKDLAELIKRLTFEIIQPNDLAQIALELRQWTLFLRVIELNELIDYNQEGESFYIKPADNEIQERINFMYKYLLNLRNSARLQSSNKHFTKLK